MKKFTLILIALCLFALPTLAQPDAIIEVQINTQTIAEGDEIIADIIVRNSTNIAGADIAISVDGECLQVQNMIPGNYLPASAENGGFSPMNTFDTTTARLAANITDRQRIANGDGTFMSVQMNAACAGQSVIEITRAELVNAEGQQFTANVAPFTLEIGSQNVVNDTLNTALEVANEDDNLLFLIALGVMLFGLFGFIGLVGWRFTRSTVSVSS